jgi:hypothetical protein
VIVDQSEGSSGLVAVAFQALWHNWRAVRWLATPLPCTVIAFSSHNDSSHISGSTTVIQCSQPQFSPSCSHSCQGTVSVPFYSTEIHSSVHG